MRTKNKEQDKAKRKTSQTKMKVKMCNVLDEHHRASETARAASAFVNAKSASVQT